MNVSLRHLFEVELSYEQTREVKELLEALLDSKGWGFLRELVEDRCRNRRNELYQMTPDSVEKMVAFAKIKGGIEELELLPQIVESMLIDVQTAVRNMQDEELTDSDYNEQGDLFDD